MICLSVDGLQAGMLGPYGNTWIRTPQFNRLAACSWVADRCYAIRPDLASVLEALWPGELLQSRSWTLLTDDPTVYADAHASRFAERILLEMPTTVAAAAEKIEGTQLAALFSKTFELLQQLDESHSLWIHARGMFGPWDAPLDLRNQYADEEDPTPPTLTIPPEQRLPDDYDPDDLLGIVQAYAGQVSLLDTCLGVLLDALDEHPRKESLALALVGIRGYPLGEHRRVGICDAPLYGELLHVPSMIYRPAALATIGRCGRLLTHADLPMRLLGAEREETTRDHLIFASGSERAIRTPAWYLREIGAAGDPRRALYVKPDDLWEVNDVANRCPEIVTALAEVLARPTADQSPLADSLVASIDG